MLKTTALSIFKTLCVGLALLALSSCSSTPPVKKEARCAGVDWWEVGRTDGVSGVGLERGLAEQTRRCEGSGNPVAVDLYQNGRDTGLIDYCSPSQGLAAGQTGATYEKVCPAYLEAAFAQQYDVGRRLRALETEDSELAARIEDLESLLKATKTGTALREKINELRTRQLKLDTEISKLESSSESASF